MLYPSLWCLALGTVVSRKDYPDYHERFRSLGLRLDKIRVRRKTGFKAHSSSSQDADASGEEDSCDGRDSDLDHGGAGGTSEGVYAAEKLRTVADRKSVV